ncbi:hypothetical protein GCK32_003216 [Trichostrongylus colubriformis]|uniref:Uncharacterized protein n=1 Tax=Trichostrongylus colubriformis TaxID=6319 RepID=A0AAN8J1G6_TRICO
MFPLRAFFSESSLARELNWKLFRKKRGAVAPKSLPQKSDGLKKAPSKDVAEVKVPSKKVDEVKVPAKKVVETKAPVC